MWIQRLRVWILTRWQPGKAANPAGKAANAVEKVANAAEKPRKEPPNPGASIGPALSHLRAHIGDRSVVDRLIKHAHYRFPGKNELEIIQIVAEQYERDRR